jgi:hypothetical protein
MLNWLGIKPSYSRPRVSDDNPYAEALFRTAKYRPEFPLKGFADLDAAREWAMRFVQWYNHDHRHGGIRYVSPAQRHAGKDRALLAGRHELYQRARQANPRRWSGQTRNWTPVGAVALNPEKNAVVQAAITPEKLSGSIGEPALVREADQASRSGSAQAMARSVVDGEHRTFTVAHTMAHAAPVGGPSHRPRGHGTRGESG